MFTIQTFSGTYFAFQTMDFASPNGSVNGPLLIYPVTDKTEKVLHAGLRPVQMSQTNLFGDRTVHHVNIVGNACLNTPTLNGCTVLDLPSINDASNRVRPLRLYYSAKIGRRFTCYVTNNLYFNWIYQYKYNGWWRYRGYRVWGEVSPGKVILTYAIFEQATKDDPKLYVREIYRYFGEYLGGTTWKYITSDNYFTGTGYQLPSDNPPYSWPSTAAPWINQTRSVYTMTEQGSSKENVFAERDRIYSICSAHFDTFRSQLVPPWDSLAWTCCSNMQAVSCNSLSLYKDLLSLAEEVLSLRYLVGSEVNPRNLAKLWLSLRYGLRLTSKDVESFASAYWKKVRAVAYDTKIVRARETESRILGASNYTVTYNYKLGYNNSDDVFLRCYSSLSDWDFWPTLENVWDLVPFSFVLDFVMNIGDRLDALDKLNYLSCIRVKAVTKSYTTSLINGSDFGILPGLSVKFYGRIAQSVMDDIRMPSLFPDSGRVINLLDGSSLILSIAH